MVAIIVICFIFTFTKISFQNDSTPPVFDSTRCGRHGGGKGELRDFVGAFLEITDQIFSIVKDPSSMDMFK